MKPWRRQRLYGPCHEMFVSTAQVLTTVFSEPHYCLVEVLLVFFFFFFCVVVFVVVYSSSSSTPRRAK